MVIYPVGEENVIETEEGKVRIARAYTCDQCNSFYTPRPEKLLVEGDVYELLFERDKKAYEDYLELLGKNGARTSNYKFNEFVDKKKEPAPQPQGDGNEAQTGNTDHAENTESAENIGNVKNTTYRRYTRCERYRKYAGHGMHKTCGADRGGIFPAGVR